MILFYILPLIRPWQISKQAKTLKNVHQLYGPALSWPKGFKTVATKLNRIPTWKIKEILNENYTRGRHGADYEESTDELKSILWERQAKEEVKQLGRDLRERAKHEKEVEAYEKEREAARTEKTDKTIGTWAKVHIDLF